MIARGSSGTGIVRKDGEILPYLESFGGDKDKFALMLSAVFSEPEIYKCQIKRLMAHSSELAELYGDKRVNLAIIDSANCQNTVLISSLDNYNAAVSNTALNFENSISSQNLLNEVYSKAKELENENKLLSCKMF